MITLGLVYMVASLGFVVPHGALYFATFILDFAIIQGVFNVFTTLIGGKSK